MSSGSHFPPPVKAVEIPKPHGSGVRMLGVPTIADRVAQTVVAMHLEARADHRFHPDSYGYRPRKSAHQAIAVCRTRCWKYDWVIDLDVQKFFDELPWDLVIKAVKAVTDCRWALLYVERWLAAPLKRPDRALEQRSKGAPQGSAVSPVLRTCSCTTRSIPGWPGACRAAGLSAMATTRSCTADRGGRPKTCWPGSPRGCKRSGSGCTRTRRRSSIARSVGAGRRMSTPRLPSSGTPSGHAGHAPKTAGASPAFYRRSAPRH
jgi:hypothetical protein